MMSFPEVDNTIEQAEGQTTYEMANLRPRMTGLPFFVWVSQKSGPRHDVRVKVAAGPKVVACEMGVYAVRPFGHVTGQLLDSEEEQLLAA